MNHRISQPDGEVRVAIVGKYTQLEDAYKSIAEALTHAGIANAVRVRPEWIDAEIFEGEGTIQKLEGYNAILIPGGFGERGTEGMIRAAQFAREHKVPYLGICLGMQMAVIEASRNLVGIKDAGSAEFNEEAGKARYKPVIYLLKEWVQGNRTETRDADADKGGTMRLGAYPAVLKGGAGSLRSTGPRRSPNATATATRSTSSIATSSKRRASPSPACPRTDACPKSSRSPITPGMSASSSTRN